MTDKTSFKYSIKFNQSLSNGMIAFEGYMAFDDMADYDTNKNLLWQKLQEQDKLFRDNGFRTACEIPNNMDKLATKNAQAKLGKVDEKDKIKK
jgi:hypothetical protein